MADLIYKTSKHLKSYATRDNAVKAFQKTYGNANLRFTIIATEDGRFVPAGIGQRALDLGVHFNFAVIG